MNRLDESLRGALPIGNLNLDWQLRGLEQAK